MSPFAIVDGTGSYRTPGGDLLRPGANPIDEETAVQLREKSPVWVTVQEDRLIADPPQDPEPVEEDVVEPFEKFRGRDGLWYFYREPAAGQSMEQSDGYPLEEEADAAIEEARSHVVPLASELETGPESGTLTGKEFEQVEFPCRGADCGESFKSAGHRTNHERVRHPVLYAGGKQP